MIKYIVLSNSTQWCYNCWKSAVDGDRVRYFSELVPFEGNRFFSKVCTLHYRVHLKHLSLLPFTNIWYRRIENALKIDDKVDTVIIVYDWHRLSRDFDLLRYLRERHHNLHIVYLFSNIVKVTGARLFGILLDLNSQYDAVYAFDKQDAKEYNFDFSPLIYTTSQTLPVYSNDFEYDLFYLGRAKDRYDTLIEVFEKAKSEGLKCNFTIVGVPKECRKYQDEISYDPIPYAQALDNMGKSKCIVDMIQGGSTALTIKTCEAVLLGRKLLTSNQNVVNEPFYHSDNIHIYNPTDCISDFINRPYIPYTKEDCYYFSPENLFDKIESKLFVTK